MKEGAARTGPIDDLVPLAEEGVVIARLQQGDRAAFAVLYDWYGDRLFRQAILPRLPDRDLAEDCLIETFRTALERIGSFRLQGTSIFFWLRRIAINKAIDVHRRRRRAARLEEAVRAEEASVTPEPGPDRPLEQEELERAIGVSLGRLRERDAAAIRLRLLEERSREECAAVLGVTVAHFDVILHRAAKAFRKVYPP